MTNFDFCVPTKSVFGWGRLSEIKDIVASIDGRHIFLTTGKASSKKSGSMQRVLDSLSDTKVTIFDEVEENPTIATVDRGAEICRLEECDLVLSLGGGSVLDAAKAMAMLQANPGSIEDYLDGQLTCLFKGLPHITVPTTAGTGSEITPFIVITNSVQRAKPAIASPLMYPDVAIVDPELTLSMPPAVIASTGLDALCQAVEGFWSLRANPLSRSLSGRGIILSMRNLEAAWRKNGMEPLARMALASHITGFQMSHVGNTAIHALSYPFTVDFDVPHGFACAIFLPVFLRFNQEAIKDIFPDILAALKIPSIDAFADEIEKMMKRIGAPTRLSEFGVTENLIENIVKRGVSPSTALNPKSLNEKDLTDICKSLL